MQRTKKALRDLIHIVWLMKEGNPAIAVRNNGFAIVGHEYKWHIARYEGLCDGKGHLAPEVDIEPGISVPDHPRKGATRNACQPSVTWPCYAFFRRSAFVS
jgi:hypothetical protein